MQDNFGRPVDNMSPEELAKQMSSPVSGGNIGDVLKQLSELAESQKKTSKELENAVSKTYASNQSIMQKLDALGEAVNNNVKAALDLNKRIKESGKSKNSTDNFSVEGINDLVKNTKPHPKIGQTLDMLLSSNTTHVKDKEMRKMTKMLIGLIKRLNDISHGSLNVQEQIASRVVRGFTDSSATAGIKDVDKINPFSEKKEKVKDSSTTSSSSSNFDKYLKSNLLKSTFSGRNRSPKSNKEFGFGETYKEYQFNMKNYIKNGNLNIEQLKKISALESYRLRHQGEFNLLEHKAVDEMHEKIAAAKSLNEVEKLTEEYHNTILGISQRLTGEYKSQFHWTKLLEQEFKNEKTAKGAALKLMKEMWDITVATAKNVNKLVSELQQAGYGYQVMDKMTENIFENNRKWVQDSASIAHYQGISTAELEKHVNSSNTIYSTGKELNVFQRQQLELHKKGLKDVKDVKKLTETSLRLSTIIGSNTENTVELMRKFKMELNLSGKEMVRMSTSMKNVALSTGLSGDEMMNVVSGTQKSMENMRNMGTLTVATTQQIMMMNAEAQKLGVGNQMQEFNNALTAGIGAGPKSAKAINLTAYALESLGKKGKITNREMNRLMEDMQLGLLDSSGIETIHEGIAEYVKQVTGGRDLKSLSRQEKHQLDVHMQTNFGLAPGELDRMAKSNKSYTDRLAELNKEKEDIDDKNITNLQKAQIYQKENNLKFNESLKLLSKIRGGESIGGNNDQSSLKSLGIKSGSNVEAQQALIKSAFTQYKKSYNEAINAGDRLTRGNIGPMQSEKELLSKIQRGGPEAEEAIAQLEENNAKIQTEMTRLKDPITTQTTYLYDIRDTLQRNLGGLTNYFTGNGWFSGLSIGLSTLGKMIGGLTGVATAGFSIFSSLYSVWSSARNFKNALSEVESSTGQTRIDVSKLWRAAGHAGSLYTHDIHLERLMKQFVNNNNGSILDVLPSKVSKSGKFKKTNPGKGGLIKNKLKTKAVTQKSNKFTPKAKANKSSVSDGSGRKQGLIATGLGAIGITNMLGFELPGQNLLDSAAQITDMASTVKEGTEVLSQGSNVFSKMAKNVNGKLTSAMEFVGSKISNIGQSSSVGNAVGSIGSKISGLFGNIGTQISKIPGASMVSKAGGKVAPFLAPIIGSITGGMQAESVGRGTVEGTILGALTGDADTGSALSSYVGIQQGSASDEALGVLGAGATGALTGAAIGSVIPVVGTGIGAAIGGVIGTGAELYKIFTKPDSPLRKTLNGWGEGLWNGVKNAGSFFLTGGLTGMGVKAAYGAISNPDSPLRKTLSHWGEGLWNGVKNAGSFLLDGLSKGSSLSSTGIVSAVSSLNKGNDTSLDKINVGNVSDMMAVVNNLEIAGKSKISSVSPMLTSNSTIENKIQKEEIANDPDKRSTTLVSGIGEVENNTAVTAEQLTILVKQMNELITLMSMGGNSSGRSSIPKSNERKNIVMEYGKWQFDGFEANASHGPIITSN